MTAPPHLVEVSKGATGDLAVMLTGGGARAAYQVGLLKGLANHFPALRIRIITGASAGAINATYLAAHQGSLAEKARRLEQIWCELSSESIYRFDWKTFVPFRAALAAVLPRKSRFTKSRPHAIVDSTPFRNLACRILDTRRGTPIAGIEENIRSGELTALALMTLDYSTGQTVRWVQGRNFDDYEGPNHRTVRTRFTVEHVMASAALPFVFPAVRIGNSFHGDGSIRMAAPLSPAVQLGAHRIIAMSTGHLRSPEDASHPAVSGYPPAAQILGQLVNAIFLDGIEEDVARMQRMNALLRKIAPSERDGLKPIDLLVLRPSLDLGMLSAEYEPRLPRKLKFLVRALGVKQTESPDFISLLMFEPAFTKRIIDLGEADIGSRLAEIRAFLGEDAAPLAAVR